MLPHPSFRDFRITHPSWREHHGLAFSTRIKVATNSLEKALTYLFISANFTCSILNYHNIPEYIAFMPTFSVYFLDLKATRISSEI